MKSILFCLSVAIICGCSRRNLTGEWEMRRGGLVETMIIKQNRDRLTGQLYFTRNEVPVTFSGLLASNHISFEYFTTNAPFEDEEDHVHAIFEATLNKNAIEGSRVLDINSYEAGTKKFKYHSLQTNLWTADKKSK